MTKRYDFSKIEKKWQALWRKEKVYEPDMMKAKKPFYNLMMFPYPSAEGLHVGNMYAFTGADIYGRFKRMQGNDVFEPIGLDGFGIHSENYALKIGTHPMKQSKISEKRFYKQLEIIGNGYAWSHHLETYDSEYYRWTQWIFIQLFKAGLAYRKKQPVNWCPSCKTVLADEQVVQAKRKAQSAKRKEEVNVGVCERCGTVVIKKDLEQWFFRITNYAERLLKNLDVIDWSEKVKIAQRNWIGKSEGALIKFLISKLQFPIEVFTTRPDTLFGATYLVLSPEHEAVASVSKHLSNWNEVKKYIEKTKKKSEEERMENKDPSTGSGQGKTGVELKGIKAINPATKEKIPVWVADYVLSGYGTGAIMAVPAHDERDFEFAKKFKLPLREVIEPETGKPLPDEQFRRSVAVIVEDPATHKFLTLNWGPKLGGTLLIGGGREEGEDEIKTALREIREEAGYVNLEFVGKTGRMYHHYFAYSKNVARIIEVVGLHFRLRGGERSRRNLQADEKGNFKIEWLTRDEMLRKIEDEVHLLSFRRLILGEEVYTGEGRIANSGKFDGLDSEKAKWEIAKFVGGKKKIQYRLRDWLISRQRYWGPPIPMIFCEACAKNPSLPRRQAGIPPLTKGRLGGVSLGEKENPGWIPVPEEKLPVKLPFVKDFRPKGKGESPLASVKSFYETKCPRCGGKARRETDVSDTFLDSAWYQLRYPTVGSKHAKTQAFDHELTRKWLPVNMYIGGAEHSVLHLLYVRFVAMVFHDMGFLEFEEPFPKFRAHGLLIKDSAKMSKSRGNVVNPDEYIKKFGADALRMYLMFIAPFEDGGDFQDNGILGVTRFLNRVWKLTEGRAHPTQPPLSKGRGGGVNFERILHQTVKKVTEDIESLHYNTAISALMILLNEMEKNSHLAPRTFELFIKLLAPFAPHLAEELWRGILGNKKSIHVSEWPHYDPALIKEDTFTLIIQVNGKVRDSVEAPTGISEREAERFALSSEKVKTFLVGARPKRVIYVPGRLVSIVV